MTARIPVLDTCDDTFDGLVPRVLPYPHRPGAGSGAARRSYGPAPLIGRAVVA
ncbi:hypothetical protein ACIQGZ_17930 [Streptomyces sp. NPDC092296]|uniref:hypothetical protein n=1 Tax=Streptomyces sp. NPDC092296 TaxID=3366012 RepID=UPI0037FEA9E9